LRVGRDLYDPSLTGERGGDIEIAFGIKSQTLWPAQAAIENVYTAVLVNSVHRIKAGSGRPGHIKLAIRTEGQMVGGDARLQCAIDKNLAVAANFEDSAAAVADVKVLLAIKGDSGGNAHALGIRRHGAVGRHTVDRAIVARGDIHLAFAVEGDAGGVHHLREKWLHAVAGINFEDRDWSFLSASAGKGNEDVPLVIERGIGDGMKVFCDGDGQLDLMGM